MRLAQSFADFLKDHVVLEVEGIDRMCLNFHVPQLQGRLRRGAGLSCPPPAAVGLVGSGQYFGIDDDAL